MKRSRDSSSSLPPPELPSHRLRPLLPGRQHRSFFPEEPISEHQDEEGEEKGDDPDGSSDEGDEEASDGDGGAENENGGGESDDDHDMHIMRQLLEGFRTQQLSPTDREALMRSAGGQFTELLTQHWKEKSNPPRWLVSLFHPAPTPSPISAAQVAQKRPRAATALEEVREEERAPAPPFQPFVRQEPATPQSFGSSMFQSMTWGVGMALAFTAVGMFFR